MGSIDDDIAWLQTQLTLARWHLDAAMAAPAGDTHRNIDRARQAYQEVLEAMGGLSLTAERRGILERELARIRDRLLAAGAQL